MKNIIKPVRFDANLAPDAFRRWALQYYKCKQDFKNVNGFSPVPYFLLCRGIELSLKAGYLEKLTQDDVRKDFGHDLWKLYEELPATKKVLDTNEEEVLKRTSYIYSNKDFEYFEPEDALSGFKRYPDLDVLDRIAAKLLDLR